MDVIILLLMLAAVVWYWMDSLRALEIARNEGRKLCNEANVQFLNDTVERIKLTFSRNSHGRRVFRRTYRFEFSETGDSRLEGSVILLGDQIEEVAMDPYQILP